MTGHLGVRCYRDDAPTELDRPLARPRLVRFILPLLLPITAAITKLAPERVFGWIHRAYALHELKRMPSTASA